MNWNTLSYLHHIAEYGSFLDAAEYLQCTQAHLSIKIAQLEKILGYPLFRRTDRGVFPTRKGQEFLAILTPFMHDLHGVAQIGARENGHRTFRIVATHAVIGARKNGHRTFALSQRTPSCRIFFLMNP